MNYKLKTRYEIREVVRKLKEEGKKIVTTNGSFDILHVAHLRLLQRAKSLGDIFIVLVNSDKSIKRFKGEKRPIIPEQERAEHLSHLASVDYVVIFDEDTPISLLKDIKPDVHVKGGSFIGDRIKDEKKLLESWNGKFVNFELEEGYSTTNIIQNIIDKYKDSTSALKECYHEDTDIFNRNLLKVKPLSERESKSDLSILVEPDSKPIKLAAKDLLILREIAGSIKEAKKKKAPIIFAFGAHFIKNGLSKILISLMEKGYVQHVLGNGAISIHDWELSYYGKTEEDVKRYVSEGQFGIWEETGKYINKAISENRKIGYGRALGKLIWEEKLSGGKIKHANKDISIFGKAYSYNIPISVCPGIGYDIIYTHPMCDGAAIGEASYIDFLRFAKTLTNFENGVYISIGSAITSPMVFEKALSMAKNLALQQDRKLENYNIYVNDIQEGKWDWSKGEPPKDNPAYYLRFMKTFARMGGISKYIKMDNKAFLHNLYHLLK